MKKDTLLTTCLKEFNMTLTDFASFSGISRSTMDGWSVRNRVSPIGEVALKLLLENKHLKDGYDADKSGFKYCPCCGQEIIK